MGDRQPNSNCDVPLYERWAHRGGDRERALSAGSRSSLNEHLETWKSIWRMFWVGMSSTANRKLKIAVA